MDALEISQRLLGRKAVIPVRFDGIAKFGQRSLGGQGQMRAIDPSLPAQEIRDRIGGGRRSPSASFVGLVGGRAAGDCVAKVSRSALAGFETGGAAGA